MGLFTRRHFLAALGAAAIGVGSNASAAVASRPSSVTLWRLNPDWGEPLTTATGSDTKSRCRGRACHAAAAHRFFLTAADAVAGRLHPCCLAQPTPVEVCIDLNELVPYYRARLGGVDARCPELPSHLREALYVADRCSMPGGPDRPVDPGPPSDPTSPDPDEPDAPVEPTVPDSPSPTTPGDPDEPSMPTQVTPSPAVPSSTRLPATGGDTAARLAAAVALTAAGAGMVWTQHQGRRPAPLDGADEAGDQRAR